MIRANDGKSNNWKFKHVFLYTFFTYESNAADEVILSALKSSSYWIIAGTHKSSLSAVRRRICARYNKNTGGYRL